jgi:CBS domain-containing protein
MVMSRTTARTRNAKRPRSPARPARRASPALPLPYNLSVADVLSAPPILVGADATLFDAMVLMRTYRVSGLPVIDASGVVVGILSLKDLSRVIVGSPLFPEITGVLDVLIAGLAQQPNATMRKWRQGLEHTLVREAMSSPAFVVTPMAPLELAAEVMTENEINRLPVVDRGRLVGVVTRHDLVRALVPRSASRSKRPPA